MRKQNRLTNVGVFGVPVRGLEAVEDLMTSGGEEIIFLDIHRKELDCHKLQDRVSIVG